MSLYTEASIIITPNAVKEDKLYAIKPGDGSGDLVVTRATTATRVNSDGLIEQVPYNLFTYSQNFTNASWSKLNTTFSSDTLTASAGNATKLIFQNQTTQGSQTVFFDVEYVSHQWIQIGLGTGASDVGYVNFNIQNKTIGTQAGGFVGSIVDYGTYVRIIVNINTIDKTSVFLCFVDSGTSSRADSTSSTGAIKLYKSQLVSGSSAKEYFPTTDRLDVPRLDYTNSSCPSILVEPQRTNVLTYSEQFDNAIWLKANTTVTANQTISPDGTQNADTLLATSGMTSFLYRSFTLTSGTPYTFSIYVKKKTITALGNRFRINFVNNLFVNFNGSVPVITGGSGIIENAGNGFYRIITTVTPSVTSNTLYIYPDGNNNNADEYYIWGAQLEAGSYATSYIPTIASSVTRNEDVISKTGISSLIGQTEGAAFVDINVDLSYTQNDMRFINISDGTSTNWWFIGTNLSNQIRFYFKTGATTYVSQSLTLTSGRHKLAFAYKSNDYVAYVDGIQVHSLNSLIVGATSRIDLGNDFSGGRAAKQFINSALIFKERLSNTELAQLTTI